METFSALLSLCAGNPPVAGEFPTQRPVTRSFDVFFDLCLNKRYEINSQRHQNTPFLQSQYNDPDDLEAHGTRPSAAMLLTIWPEYSALLKSKVNQARNGDECYVLFRLGTLTRGCRNRRLQPGKFHELGIDRVNNSLSRIVFLRHLCEELT